MDLAHIVPVSMLNAQPEYGAYLAISTLVLRYPAYAAYYRAQSERGMTVILDNPVHEDGHYTLEDTLAAAEKIKPTVIVIPDTIDNVDATMMQALKCAPEIAHYFPQASLMGVPHAIHMRDYLAAAEAMVRIPHVNYLGVSLERRLRDDAQALSRRRERVLAIKTSPRMSPLRIHLLGISERATELADPLFQRACSSVDASKFAVWALNGTPVLPSPPIAISYPGRERFGGSERYFDMHDYPFGNEATLRRNLLTWTNYALEMSTMFTTRSEVDDS